MADRSFFVTISQRTHFFVFGAGVVLHRPSTFAAFSERVSLIIPLLFSLLAFSFRFLSTEEQKNIFEFGLRSYEAYVLVSDFFFTLAFGRWLLALHYVMLNMFQHLTASLFLSFSADRS